MSELDAIQIFNPYALNNLRPGQNTSEKKRARETGKASSSFLSFLTRRQPEDTEKIFTSRNTGEIQNDIALMLDDVHSTGDALKKNPRPDEIKRYKDAVKNFIGYVVRHSFEIEESTGVKRINKPQKKYTTIHIIDEKLERLAAGIMSGQFEQLKLLQRIDEIHGLIVDLLN